MAEALIIFIALIVSIILGITSALLIKFIDSCFNDGDILDWYYRQILALEPKWPRLSKALGLCPKCFGFWVSFFLFMLYHQWIGLDAIFFWPYVACCQFVISLLFKDSQKEQLND
jgi:hypothetical protein